LTTHKTLRLFCLFSGLVLPLAFTGCGGNGVIIPHTTGNFSNASFKGAYVFQIRGFISQTGNPYRQVGVIVADGNGNITSGSDDVNTIGAGAAITGPSITGSYSIGNDGTGQIVLSGTSLSAAFTGAPQITLAVTLESSSVADIMEADSFADGAGTAELQDTAAAGASPSGTFVFRLHDDANAQNAAESEVGILASNGTSFSGSADQSLVSSASALTLNGSFTAPNSFGIGTATFTDSSNVTTSLLYYIVNTGKVLLLTADNSVGSGSAEAQSGTVSAGLSGNYVFGSRGDDLSGGTGAVATVGQFSASGSTISAGALDSMQDGNYSGPNPVLFTGSVAAGPTAQGREQVTLNLGQTPPTMVFWLVSPSRAYFLFENESAVEDGTADLQTGSSFSASTTKGQYALVMDGIDFTPQAVARIGTLQFDGSSGITLVELVNDSSSGVGAQPPGALAGHYQVGGSGRITTQITSNGGGGPDLVGYAASGSRAYVLQVDPGTNTSGTITLQQ
jgi:hypothetical protein